MATTLEQTNKEIADLQKKLDQAKERRSAQIESEKTVFFDEVKAKAAALDIDDAALAKGLGLKITKAKKSKGTTRTRLKNPLVYNGKTKEVAITGTRNTPSWAKDLIKDNESKKESVRAAIPHLDSKQAKINQAWLDKQE